MSTLSFKVLDLDFPAGSKNKTATLVTGEQEALLVDAGFTRADGHRLAAEILDSGKKLTTVFVSHGDPDFYFGAEVLADAFPDAAFVATPIVIEHIKHSYEGKLKAWAALGPNLRSLPAHLLRAEVAGLAGSLASRTHTASRTAVTPGTPFRPAPAPPSRTRGPSRAVLREGRADLPALRRGAAAGGGCRARRPGACRACEVPQGRPRAPQRRGCRELMVRLWCATGPPVWTTKSPRVSDLGVSHGAGDENRTRALSLGSDGAWKATWLLTCAYVAYRRPCEAGFAPLLIAVVRS
ncbi:MBL fold metallo-hydrolase [Streptomyces coeruleorubidus]|uniref:MBL fold metallo-hydrolase n=1 Tax=Streptomyces coeruleorubidus TaxID=116188 RepID=UPI0031597665